ncbi:MAG: Maf family protein [Planctomycetota bacterium]|nr:Maf family protein [Planctomycetota bacterium]
MARIVLGSASPRRRELLAAAGIDFEIEKPDVDESLPAGVEPSAAARLLAERKARAIVERHARVAEAAGRPSTCVVLAADTIVAVERDGRFHLLGKPEDERDAARMLTWISGTRHQVVTGVCALSTRPGAEPALGHERTWVTMRAIAPHEVAAYVASGEWQDKAGGYAIQESADRFVARLEEGGFDNVVGLPVRLALDLLRRAGALVPGPVPGYPSRPSEAGPPPSNEVREP